MVLYIFSLGNCFCLTSGGRDNFELLLSHLYIWVIPKSLHFLLGFSEMCVPLKEWLKSSPGTEKLEKSRNFALYKEYSAREVLQRELKPLGSQRQDLEQIGLGWHN